MKISVIIPAKNEALQIGDLVRSLLQNPDAGLLEVIVVDGQSEDATSMLAEQAGARVIRADRRGRAIQMNLGAQQAGGDILYFVHADARPPETFVQDIRDAVQEGYPMGCYRFRFDSPRWLLRINSYMTRFDRIWCRGGDQTLYVTRALFEELGGFRDEMQIMEDYDIILRARELHRFRIIPKDVLVSARKYELNGYLRVQFANLMVFTMYRMKCSQGSMVRMYRRLLRW